MKTNTGFLTLSLATAVAVAGVSSVWGGIALEATDWVGNGSDTRASLYANWYGNAIPTTSMRFSSGAIGKTVTFDAVYGATSYVWTGTDIAGAFYDPTTGETHPVIWEATDPSYGINQTANRIIIADSANQNGALWIKSGTYWTADQLRIAYAAAPVAAWVYLEEGSLSSGGDLRMCEGNGAIGRLIVGSGDPAKHATLTTPITKWAVVSASGGDSQITLRAGGEFHVAYCCQRDTTKSKLVFDGGAFVKDGDVSNQVGYLYGGDYPSVTDPASRPVDQQIRMEVTANGGVIDIQSFDTRIDAQIRLAEGVTDGVLTKRGTATLVLGDAGSAFDGTFRVAAGALQLGTVGENTKAILDGGTLSLTGGALARLEVVKGAFRVGSLPAHAGKVVVSGGELQVTVDPSVLEDGVPYRTSVNVATDFELADGLTTAAVFKPFRFDDFDFVQSVDDEGFIVLTPSRWTRTLTLRADTEALVIDEPIGAEVVDVHKYGTYDVTFAATNAFTGVLYIHEGALVADRGVGIPAGVQIVLAGGTWVSRAGGTVTDMLGTGAGAFLVETGANLKLATSTQPLTVNFGGVGDDYVVPNDEATEHTIEFNNYAGATAPLTFMNPIHYSSGNLILQTGPADAAATVTLGGSLTWSGAGGDVFQRGTGTVNYDAPFALGEKFLSVEGGAAKLTSALDGTTATVGHLTVGVSGKAEMTQEGGTAKMYGINVGSGKNYQNLILGDAAGSEGTYNLKGGKLSSDWNTFVGYRGTGRLCQTGGEAEFGTRGWLVIGQASGGKGTYQQSGGTARVVSASLGCIVGENGDGTLDVSGEGSFTVANEFRLTSNAGSKSTVNVHDGGRLAVGYLKLGSGASASLNVDGGTLAYSGATDRSNFFGSPVVPITVGEKGMTFDTGAATVSSESMVLLTGDQSGPFTKIGTGKMSLNRLPETSVVNVSEGTLTTSGVMLNKGLTHRWSFNGDLTDSVGGQTAQFSGTGVSFTADGKQVRITPNGTKRVNFIDLGANVVPKDDTPFTLEFWTTLHEMVAWSHIFCFTTSGQAGLMANFCTSGANSNTSINCMEKNVNSATGTSPVGQEFHYSVVVVPDGVNGATVTAYLKNAVTGATIGKSTLYYADWNVERLNLQRCWLGTSGYPNWNDPDSNASYNEVRVWNRALSEDELTHSAKMGPEALIPFELDDGTHVQCDTSAATATDALTHRWSFNGSLADSVGGQTATLVGDLVALSDDNQQVRITPNGSKRVNYINLGANVLPKDREPVTLEFWTTLHSTASWMHIFSFGTSAQSGLMANFCTNGNNSNTSLNNMNKNANFTTGTAPVGTEVYYAVVIVPDAAGGSAVTAYLKNATTGATIGKNIYYYTDVNLQALDLKNCFLGASAYASWNDPDADASYNEVRVWKRSFSEEELGRNAQLGPDTLPDLSAPEDTGNVLPSEPDALLVANNYLTHRWTFNGGLKDSVGDQHATIGAGTPTYTATTVSMPSASNGTSSWIDLGPNLLPKTGPVTVEFWVTQNAFANWGYLFEVGSSKTDRISFFGTVYQTARESGVAVGHGSAEPTNSQIFVMPQGVPYHIAMVFVPSAEGGMDVTVYQQDVLTGLTRAKVSFHRDFTLADINQAHGWLGRSPYNDANPSATYDEYRIWNAALSEAQLTRNAQLGPDALPRISPNFHPVGGGCVNVAAGATFDLGGSRVTVNTLSGAGQVVNGTAGICSVLSPGGDGTVGTLTFDANVALNGILKLDRGDLISGTGDIDLRGATIDFAPPADDKYDGVFAITTKLGGIVGPVNPGNLPTKCRVKISGDGRRAVIMNLGLILTIR